MLSVRSYNTFLLHTEWTENTISGNSAPDIQYAHPLDDNKCVLLVKL